MRKILMTAMMFILSLPVSSMNETKKEIEKPEVRLTDNISDKNKKTAEGNSGKSGTNFFSEADVVEKALERETENLEVYETGTASFYGGKWHGRRTANGEIFNTHSLTAAHKTLPFNTKVKVTNLSNGKSVIVRINNRGPYTKGRVIDLSTAAFSSIESTKKGITKVQLQIVK